MSRAIALVQAKLLKMNAITAVLCGSVFLALMSQIVVPLPFTPVPMTMQTFGLFCIGGCMSGRRALMSVLLYLLAGTVGIPVMAMHSSLDPLWFVGSTAGYLVGFAAAAAFIGYMTKQRKTASFTYLIAVLTAGEALILGTGTLWLAYFVGFEQAMQWGFYPFIVIDSLKVLLAASILKIKNSYAL